MAGKLAETLLRLRGISGASLREVEKHTGVSNAYLSQLETGKIANPSPEILFKLAEYYRVPYPSLMEAAGYLRQQETRATKRPSAVHSALMSADLSDEEQDKVADFIEFLRAQRRPRKS